MANFHHIYKEGAKPQTLVLLHGTGADERDLLPLGEALMPGANIISPKGQVLEGTMSRWFARLSPGVFDQDDLRQRCEELREFLVSVVEQKNLDKNELYLLGFSNGANMAAAMVMLYPELFAGAILLRAMMPLESAPQADLSGKHIYMASGTRDQMISEEGAKALAEYCRSMGADFTINWVDGGHGLFQSELSDVKSWLDAEVLN